MKDFKQRALKASEIYLERKGYEVVATGYECEHGRFDFVAIDDDNLVFVELVCRSVDERIEGETFADSEMTRNQRELVSVSYLSENPNIPEGGVRFDIISLAAIGNEKAIIRHHINCTEGL